MNNNCQGPCLPHCSSNSCFYNKILLLFIGIFIGIMISILYNKKILENK